MNTQRTQFYTDRALDSLNRGFTSKAGQQRAIDDLDHAFDAYAQAIRDGLLASSPTREERDQPEWQNLYYGVPALHNWKAKHSAAYSSFVHEVAEIEGLVELRNAVKAAPINAPLRATPHPLEVKAQETIQELIARRQGQYHPALDLGEIFGGLPVSANVHWVENAHGTKFIRAFYYLRGEFTPLNVIIAAAQELERRTKGDTK